MALPGQPLRFDDPDLHWDNPRLRYGQPFPAPTTSMDNRISATLADADLTAITAAIATIRRKLPFLVTLTLEQRKKMAIRVLEHLHEARKCLLCTATPSFGK